MSEHLHSGVQVDHAEAAAAATGTNFIDARVSVQPNTTPTASVFTGTNQAQTPAKTYACVLCQQRKVKCDKTYPCASCKRSKAQCIYRAPAPPKRRKKRGRSNSRSPSAEEEDKGKLMERLRRYEKILKNAGIDIDSSFGVNVEHDRGDDAAKKVGLQTDSQNEDSRIREGSVATESGIMIAEKGMSRYLENNLWTGLGDEFRDTQDVVQSSSSEEDAYDDRAGTPIDPTLSNTVGDTDGNFIFGLPPAVYGSLTSLHPSTVHIFQLWQTFLQFVHPLTMIIHAPTTQPQLLTAAADLANVSKSMEVLMFAIYSCSVASLSNEECQQMFGESKQTLSARYQLGAQRALVNAQFLKTTDLVVLQAYLLFLHSVAQLSVRPYYDHQTLWTLIGIAIRIAQRMGLHRDGDTLGLKPFDGEIRRRVWWPIVMLDGRIQELSGVGTSLLHTIYDTKIPHNLNDSDLYPEMTALPPEHTGLTEMMFNLIRFEVFRFFRTHMAPSVSNAWDGGWQYLSTKSVSMAEKDKSIDRLEATLKQKYVRFCDPSIPLHVLVQTVAYAAIARMRLVAHHPRLHPPDQPPSKNEQRMLFNTCIKILEYDRNGHEAEGIKHFLWHIKSHFQFHSLIYLFSIYRTREIYDDAEEQDNVELGWQLITNVFEKYHPDFLVDARRNTLYAAIGNLAIKAWEVRKAVFMHRKNIVLPTPKFVEILYRQRGKEDAEISAAEASFVDVPAIGQQLEQQTLSNEVRYEPYGDIAGSGSILDFTAGFVQVSDTSPMDWNYWDELMNQGAELQNGGFMEQSRF